MFQPFLGSVLVLSPSSSPSLPSTMASRVLPVLFLFFFPSRGLFMGLLFFGRPAFLGAAYMAGSTLLLHLPVLISMCPYQHDKSHLCPQDIDCASILYSTKQAWNLCSRLAFDSGRLNNSHYVMTRDSISVRDTTGTASKCRSSIQFLQKEAIPFGVPLSISCNSAIPHSLLFSNIDAVMLKVGIFKRCVS